MKKFKNGQTVSVEVMGEIISRVYVGKIGDLHAVSDAFGKISTCDNDEIDPKPKETFIDVEITWNEFKGYVKHNEHDMCLISNLDVGYDLSHGILSCYIFDDHSDGKPNGCKILDSVPFLFINDRKEIGRKATHARFVKIKGNE